MSDQIQPVEFNPPKSEWGDGPWNEEPDREDFEHAGFACLALRSHHGNWCGYVGVPPGHPAYGEKYDDVNVDVHGGLSYGRKCDPPICHVPKPGESDDVWWLGFDCSHAWDLSPGVNATLRIHGIREEPRDWEVYRNLEFVKGEIRSLAEQLAEMAQSPS